MFANFKPQTVQKRTVIVPKKSNGSAPSSNSNIKRAASTPNLKPPSLTPSAAKKLSPRPSPRPSPNPSQRSTPPRKAPLKRKIPTPVQRLSSSDESSSDEDDVASRKRSKLSNSLEPDRVRKIWITEEDVKARASKVISGADLAVDTDKKQLKPVFDKTGDAEEVLLRYPSNSEPEKFKLVKSRDSESFDPLEDILQTIEQVCTHYFPAEKSKELTDDLNGFPRRIKSAIYKQSQADFTKVVAEFNTLVKASLADRTIPRALENSHSLSLPLVERILSQCTSRTVSPHVSMLRQYENGGDNVYGELLPRFIHQIFRETNLNSSSVFVDLGSGVGNVVLQAALETGAESWGIEMMPNPVKLARSQGREFKSRCALWGIQPGTVNLLSGDFTASPEITALLPRADVILVNNQAFNPSLNEQLMLRFLDVKEGARIVSLKSFVPSNWELKQSNLDDIRNTLSVKRGEYFSGSVSWTNAPGDYYIATKDFSRLKAFQDGGRRRR